MAQASSENTQRQQQAQHQAQQRHEAASSQSAKPHRNGKKDNGGFPFKIAPFDLDSWSIMNADALGTLPRTGVAWVNSLIDINSEVLEFLNRRWSEDISIQRRLVTAKSLEDIQAIYSEFFATASNQYGEESQKLAEMSSRMAKATFEAMQEDAPGK